MAIKILIEESEVKQGSARWAVSLIDTKECAVLSQTNPHTLAATIGRVIQLLEEGKVHA